MPTGWTYDMARKVFPVRRKGGCSIHLVPYSEHSSYLELLEYVEFLRPHQVCLGLDAGLAAIHAMPALEALNLGRHRWQVNGLILSGGTSNNLTSTPIRWQVIPTVGVEGESGEQAMRKMQAQFRHLVDETKDKVGVGLGWVSSMARLHSIFRCRRCLPQGFPRCAWRNYPTGEVLGGFHKA